MTRRLPAALLGCALSLALLALPAAAQDAGPLPGDLPGWLSRQDRQLRGGEGERAVAEARDRVSREPQSAEACYLLGRVLANSGKLDEGKAQFDAAIALDPNYGPAWRGMAGFHAVRKDLETAAREARKAWEIDPSPESRVMLVNVLAAKGDRAAAHSLLEEGLKKDPADDDLRFLYATLLFTEELLRDAEREVRQVLASRPDHDGAREMLVTILANTGRRADADAVYRDSIKRDPKNLRLRVLYINFLVAGKEIAGAADQMDQVLQLDLPPDIRKQAETDAAGLHADADRLARRKPATGADRPDEKEILKKLGSRVLAERRGAMETLSQYTLQYVPAEVLRCTTDEDEAMRLSAMRLIGMYGDESLVGLVDELLFGSGSRETSPAVRGKAVWALGKIQSPACLPVLLAAMQEAEPEILRATLMAFRDSPAGKSFTDDPGVLVPPAEVAAVRGRIAKWWFEDATALQWRRKAAEEIGRGGYWNLRLAARVVPWVDEEDAGIRAAMLDCMARLTGDASWRSLPTGTKEERAAAREKAFAALLELQKPVKR